MTLPLLMMTPMQVWLKRVATVEPGHKAALGERAAFAIFDPMAWELVRKENVLINFSDLERAPNLPRAAGAAAAQQPAGAQPAGQKL